MVKLLQLPNELLAIIFDGLDAPSFAALRLASKYANSAALPAFTDRYFATRYAMLSRLSLQNLVEIAQHPVFGPAVRTVELCVDHFVKFPSAFSHSARHTGDIIQAMLEGRHEPAEAADDQDDDDVEARMDKAAYQLLWEEQETLMQSGLAQAYIIQALLALTHTKAIVIDNAHRPWGALAHSRQTGLPPTNSLDDPEAVEFANQVLRISLTAIIASGFSLSSFAMICGVWKDAMTPEVLRLPEVHRRYYRSLPPSLTKLEINISDEPKDDANDQWADNLAAFLNMFRELTELDLMITPVSFGRHINRLRQLVPKLALAKLQEIAVHRLDCTAVDICLLLRKHQTTLRRIYLHNVRILGGIEHWRALFAQIGTHFPSLKLTVDVCFAGQLDLFCRIKQEGVEELVNSFQLGGESEDWTEGMQFIVAK